MKTLLLLSLMALSAWAADSREADVKKAMADLRLALLKPEKAAFEKLLGEQLLYTHSNGRLESKAEVIDALVVKKSSIYGEVEYPGDPKISFYGDTAIVRQDTTVKLLGAEPRTLKLNILYVWVKSKGAWQLAARQATRYQ